MPCQKIPLGQEITGTPYESQQECEQDCCGDVPKCGGVCCPEGESCTDTYSGGEWDSENQVWLPAPISQTCCKPENVCQGDADELGRPYVLCCPDNFTCVTSDEGDGIVGYCKPPQSPNGCPSPDCTGPYGASPGSPWAQPTCAELGLSVVGINDGSNFCCCPA